MRKPFVVMTMMWLLVSPGLGRAASPPHEEPDGGVLNVEPIQAENLFECLKACNTTIENAEEFCRRLPDNDKKRKALCWASIYAGKAACQVFCRAEFGPPIQH